MGASGGFFCFFVNKTVLCNKALLKFGFSLWKFVLRKHLHSDALSGKIYSYIFSVIIVYSAVVNINVFDEGKFLLPVFAMGKYFERESVLITEPSKKQLEITL